MLSGKKTPHKKQQTTSHILHYLIYIILNVQNRQIHKVDCGLPNAGWTGGKWGVMLNG